MSNFRHQNPQLMERAVDDSGCVFKKGNAGLWGREPMRAWFAVRELMRTRGVVREPDVRASFLDGLGFSDDISDSTDRADEFYVVAVINL